MMKVKLIVKYGNVEEVIAMAGKLCYSPVGIEELEEGLTEDKIQSFIKRLMDMGHESPLEHCSFSFAVEGVSRALTHQLVRHRIASYSQQSQRYVKEEEGKFEFITPSIIKEMGEDCVKEYENGSMLDYQINIKVKGKEQLELFILEIEKNNFVIEVTK